MSKKIIAIVPSAGLGKRFDPHIRKTFADLGGTPLLVHTLKRLSSEYLITEIIPVLGKDDVGKGYLMVENFGLKKIKLIAPGGKERQDSIFNALNLLEENGTSTASIILIHDGVRPFIPEGLVERLIGELKNFDGVVPGLPVKETLKEVDAGGAVISTVNRERFRSVQTPQAFSFGSIKKAYDAAYAEGFYATDDAALVERMGGRVKIIPGSPLNIKVTTPEDMELVVNLLKMRESREVVIRKS
ncbi:MAG: 2-C-methyl-D-erythritol 4-phosphate cytidylyltransferase [Nitrospiraceae bacterium]|nr:MAG: 2-C-methyl-D-erythritol 4-phosphate cytidylyltransferase [Nitrospiraceae bacterium]